MNVPDTWAYFSFEQDDILLIGSTRGRRGRRGNRLRPPHGGGCLGCPGGGVIEAWKNQKLLNWIKERSKKVRVVLSVYSGAFILGKAGLLDGISSTTTSVMRPQLVKNFPSTTDVAERFVDAGKVITTAGLSAGIDGALHLVERELGTERASSAARYMEYDWKPKSK